MMVNILSPSTLAAERDQGAHPWVAQIKAAPQDDAEIDTKQRVRE